MGVAIASKVQCSECKQLFLNEGADLQDFSFYCCLGACCSAVDQTNKMSTVTLVHVLRVNKIMSTSTYVHTLCMA